MVGHSARLATPLSRRQLRATLAVIAATLALATGALVLAFTGAGEPHSGHGCVDVIVPSTMGAGQLHQCGAAAGQWCRSLAGQTTPQARRVLPECRRAGFRVY